jgi:type II secretory pathway pseudopilin PulG
MLPTSFKTKIAISAFTLIETLIYLGLFSILITGTLEGISALQEFAEENQTRALVESEGEYVREQISYEFSSGRYSHYSTLPVSPPDDTLFDTAGTFNDPFITNFSLSSTTEIIGTTTLEKIQVSYIANATSSNGRLFSKPFLYLTYLAP